MFYSQKIKKFPLFVFFLLFFFSYVTLTNFTYATGNSIEEAEKAYSDGKIKIALKIWESLASQGDIIALNNLGYMYEKGIGVKKNLEKSLELYLKSANAGAPIAQYNVGEIYAEGRGVKIDNIMALKWLIIAGLRGDADAMQYSEKLSIKMSESDIIKATNFARSWRPTFKNLKE